MPSFNSQQFSLLANNNSNSNLLQPNTTPPSPAATASSSSNLTTPHSYIRKPEFFPPPQEYDNTECKNLSNCENSDFNVDENSNDIDEIKTPDNAQHDLNESGDTHNEDDHEHQSSVVILNKK
jgi:hypothetical protein